MFRPQIHSIVGPLIATVLYQTSPNLPYWFAASLVALLFMFVLIGYEKVSVKSAC